MRRFTLIATLVLLSASFTACGGDEQLSTDQLSERAVEICKAQERSAEEYAAGFEFGAPNDAADADQYREQRRSEIFDEVNAELKAMIDRLSEQEPTEQAKAKWDAFLAAQRDYREQWGDLGDFQRRLAAENDPDALDARRSLAQGFVAERDSALDAAIFAAQQSLGEAAGEACPPALADLAVGDKLQSLEGSYLARLSGAYEGELHQEGPGNRSATYPVSLQLTGVKRGALGGTAYYETFPCNMNWIFLGQLGRRFLYREEYGIGSKDCAEGNVSISVVGRALDYRWRRPGEDVKIDGTLTWVSEPKPG